MVAVAVVAVILAVQVDQAVAQMGQVQEPVGLEQLILVVAVVDLMRVQEAVVVQAS